MTGDAGWLAAAVDLAVRNVAEGGGPFGAVVVRAGSCSRKARTGSPATTTPPRTPRWWPSAGHARPAATSR